jgi:hypothetical protein
MGGTHSTYEEMRYACHILVGKSWKEGREDGGSMSLRNLGIYLQVHAALQTR